MKALTKILVISMAAAISLCCVAGCSNNSGSETKTESSAASTTGDTDDTDTDTDSDSDAASTDEGNTEESSAANASVDLAAADYSNPAVTIEFGQFEEIKKLTEEMQTGKYDGQVIKVTGISQKRMNSCTIMERDESTGTGYGMTYYIDGQPELSEYPAEDAKVELLGVVTVGEYEVRALSVLPENVKVLEEVTTE